MKRKISTIILIAMLAGCVACGDTVPDNDEQSTSELEESTAAVETSVRDTLVLEDFGKYEFNIFGVTQAFAGDYLDVTEETGEPISDNVYKRNRAVENDYNIVLKFHSIDWNEGSNKIREIILAGDDTYDLLTCVHLSIAQLMADNYFVDWKTLPEIDLSRSCYVGAANETYSIGNKMPLLFGDFMETNFMRCWNFLFNKRLIEEYKLEDPYKVVDDGRWTMDYLIQVTRDIYSDLDGNSVMDENDMYGLTTDRLATLDGFTRSLKMSGIKKDKDNLPELDFWKESTVTAYEKLYTLYYESPGTYASEENMTHVENIFSVGRSVFAASRIDFVMKDAVRNMKDDYGIIPYPKLEESDDYATYLSGTFSAQMIGVTQPESDLHRTALITQALNAYSHEYVTPAIVETTLKTKAARDEESIRMVNLVFDKRQYSFDSIDEGGFAFSPLQTVRTLIGAKKSKDIASYYASREKSAKAWIEKIIKAFEQ